jgi:hypothetical protein
MRAKVSRGTLVGVVWCVLAGVGCGGTGTTGVTDDTARVSATTKNTSPHSSTTPSGSAAHEERARRIKRARARTLARARAVAGVVRDYYADVDAKRLRGAWTRLSPPVHAQIGPYEAWEAGQETTVGIAVTSVHTRRVTVSEATVAVVLRSTSVDVCARTVHQRFAGTWSLSRQRRRWVATELHIAKTGGGTEKVDYAECDQGSDPSSGNDSGSPDPGYSAPDDPGYSEPEDPGYEPGGGGSDDDPDLPDDPGDDPSFCDTHACIPNYENGRGSTVQCADGTYSHSGGIQGACSHHGGVG